MSHRVSSLLSSRPDAPAARLVSSLAQPSEALLTAFSPEVYEDGDGQKLNYRLMKPLPSDQPQGAYPLVLFLHGLGERGDDNQRQLFHLDQFATERFRQDYPCYVVVPQCPQEEGSFWTKRLAPKDKDEAFHRALGCYVTGHGANGQADPRVA